MLKCVAALSTWALVSGRWSRGQAARVEVNQQIEERERQHDSLKRNRVSR